MNKQITDESLIWRNIYILLGVTAFILLVMVGVWSFHWYSPLLKLTVEAQQNYDARSKVAATLPDSLRKQVQVQEQEVYVGNQLKFFQNKYRNLYLDYGTPGTAAPGVPASGAPAAGGPADANAAEAKKIATWQNFLNEYYSGFGLALKNDLKNAYFNSGLIDINADIKVSAPPQVPEELPPTPAGFLKPLSDAGGGMNIDITGTYPSIMNFFNIINQSSILMTVGPIKLAGTSPTIKASFTLTPYLVETGPAVKVSPAGGAAAPAASPAGGSGYPGGSSSAPPSPPPAASKSSDDADTPTTNKLGKNRGGADAQ